MTHPNIQPSRWAFDNINPHFDPAKTMSKRIQKPNKFIHVSCKILITLTKRYNLRKTHSNKYINSLLNS